MEYSQTISQIWGPKCGPILGPALVFAIDTAPISVPNSGPSFFELVSPKSRAGFLGGPKICLTVEEFRATIFPEGLALCSIRRQHISRCHCGQRQTPGPSAPQQSLAPRFFGVRVIRQGGTLNVIVSHRVALHWWD